MIENTITLLTCFISLWFFVAPKLGIPVLGKYTHWFYHGSKGQNKRPATRLVLHVIYNTGMPKPATNLVILPPSPEIINDDYQYPIIPESFPPSGDDSVPIIFDGSQWIYFDVNKGSWAVIGATGSGKGNFIMYLLLQLLFKPNIDIVVIDAKAGLDYADIEDRIKLFDGDNIQRGLEYLDAIMNDRNSRMRKSKCKNITAYNLKYPTNKINHIVFVIDEGAELNTRERAIAARLARMGRAAGLTMIFATQYPTVEAMPSQIASNLKNRVCFQVASPRYVPVALAREQGDLSFPRPDLFPHAGICVYKQIGGAESIGRVPELTDAIQQDQLAALNIHSPITPISRQDAGGKSPASKPALDDDEMELLLTLHNVTMGETDQPSCKKCGTRDNLRGTRNGFMCRECWGKSK